MTTSFLLMLACSGGDAAVDAAPPAGDADTADGSTVDGTAGPADGTSITDSFVADTSAVALDTASTTASGLVDFRTRGPYGTTTVVQTVTTSCNMGATAHVPQGFDAEHVVILAHGFARDRSKVADLADHLASWGFAVVRPDLCHGGPLGVDHPQNGEDLADLGAQVSEGRPVYFVGHSAGGLAALLASTRSEEVAGHLGLDTVDASNLGRDAAPTLGVPTAALIGMSEPCNSGGNAVGVYAGVPSARVLRVPGADHCDFESPTDGLCTTFCANGSGAEPATQELIIAMSTAWLAWQSGLAPGGEAWWTGEGLDELLALGSVEVVQ